MAETLQANHQPGAIAVTRRIQRPGIDETRVAKLTRVVEKRSETGHFSILVAQIDPDAIGSAFGMQEILSQLGASSNIYYQGRVGHPQNEALCNKCGLMGRMRPIPTIVIDEGASATDVQLAVNAALPNIVLVDSSRIADSRLPYAVYPVIVVDHHGQSDVGEERDDTFFWVDESAGSASTMVAELLSEITPEKWEFNPDLALMVCLGIYTDTKDNLRAGDRDSTSYAWVKRYADNTALIDLVRYKRPWSFFKNLSRGVQYVEKFDTHRKGRILAGLGRIPEKQGDDLAMVADEFLRTVGAPLVVTWALVEIKDSQTKEVIPKIRVCARSEDYTTNLAETLNARFGKQSGAKTLPDGSAEGGALFEFPVGPWFKDDEMEEIVNRRIIEWCFGLNETGAAESE